MQTNCNFKFEVSLSKEAYSDKVISGAMIGTTKDKENREIRKKYGFNPNKGIGFERTIVTPDSLLDSLLAGHVFCHLFNPGKLRKDGTFSSCEKKDENFAGSWVIGVDIDKTSYKTAEDFIALLTLQPTLYYTSYSNQQSNKGARFRLIYVFNELIKFTSRVNGNPYFFRYCAYNLNRIIERDTKELIEDDCNLRCSQYFNGTNKNNPGIILSSGITGNIYSLEDIEASDGGFIDFLCSYCHYKTITKEKTEKIRNILLDQTGKNYIWNTEKGCFYKIELEDKSQEKEELESSSDNGFSQEIEDVLKDWDKQSEAEFKRNYKWERLRQATPYVYRVEGEWIDEKYQFVGSDYFQLFYYKEKLEDGQMRKKALFQRMCLRRLIKPEMDLNEMAVNILIDIMRFFDNSDRTLNSDFIKNNILGAFEMSLDEIEKENHYSIKYLQEVFKPKRGIIYNGKANYSESNVFEILDEIYNRNLGIKDNLEILNNDYGFIISERRLYEYLENRGIKPEPKSLTDEQLRFLINPTISARKNINLLRKMGYKFTNDRVKGLVRVMCCEACSLNSSKEFNTTTINNRSQNRSTFDKNKDTYRDSKDSYKDTLKENKDTKKSSLMKDKDKEILELINPNLSVRKNLEELKAKGYKIGKDKVNKLLNMKKEEGLSQVEPEPVNVENQENQNTLTPDVNLGFSFKGISVNIGLPTLKFNVSEPKEEPGFSIPVPTPLVLDTNSNTSVKETKAPEMETLKPDFNLEDFTLDNLYKDFYNNFEVEDEENSWLRQKSSFDIPDYERVMVI